MQSNEYLYLIILEVDPLNVGKSYNPLPSHLTLVSRFLSQNKPEEIESSIKPIFNKSKTVLLNLIDTSIIGPKHTAVYVVDHTSKLLKLHSDLIEVLESIKVEFKYPEYNGKLWTPHITKREGSNYAVGQTIACRRAYLIEVVRTSSGDERLVHASFTLGS